MPNIHICAALIAAALSMAAGQTSAQVQFAAQTGVAILAPCPSFCGGPRGRFAFDNDGGETFAGSASSAANADGSGRAEADLGGPAGLGVLKAEASSIGSSRASALAAAMQGFHVGQNARDSYTLEVALTGQATGSAHAAVAVFRDLDPATAFAYTEDSATLLLEIYPGTPDLAGLRTMDLDLPADGTPQSASGAITIADLRPGDLFYVWASLEVVGRDGTYADAFHTLRMSFTDPGGLSQTAPVPEPGTWTLLAAGLALLMLRALRRA